jgi:hypothetical protein
MPRWSFRWISSCYGAFVTSAELRIAVHLIDKGVDTGDVLYQARLASTAEDNYSTFPYLQLVAALPLLERAADDAVAGTLRPQKVDLPSHLWSHPTLWQYVKRDCAAGYGRSESARAHLFASVVDLE